MVSQSNFQRVCRSIDPRKVKSLTLSHKDERFGQIRLFNSLFGVKQFTQLRSLTLIAIKESQLRDILKRVNISSLISLSLDIREPNDRPENMTSILLTSILTRAKLHKLVLNIQPDRIEKIRWPEQYTIEHLGIGMCRNFDRLTTIFCCLPRLRTLAIGSCSLQNLCRTDLIFFPQLTKLLLKNLNTRIDYLEHLLQVMPRLTALKLIGNGNFLNGHQWERFIQTNLPLLNKFEFYFHEDRADPVNPPDIEGIIASFRTAFWLELKKWFVTCEYNIKSPEQIRLYSMPICVSSLNSKSESTNISISNLTTAVYKNVPIMVNIDKIGFNFTKLTSSDIEQQVSMHENTIPSFLRSA
jgi:hypothetical protein